MDSTALNYNSKALHNNGNIVPCINNQDTVFSKIDLSGRTINQVVEKVNNSFCVIDYLALVEDASIENIAIIDANNVQVNWLIYQRGISHPISQSYQLNGDISETAFYLTVNCNTGKPVASNKTEEQQKTRTFRAVQNQQITNTSTTSSNNEIYAYPKPLQGVLKFKGDTLKTVAFKAIISLDTETAKQQNLVVDIASQIEAAMVFKNKHATVLSSKTGLTFNGSESLLNGGYFHLRHLHAYKKKVHPEYFCQYQWDAVKGMKNRLVGGINNTLIY